MLYLLSTLLVQRMVGINNSSKQYRRFYSSRAFTLESHHNHGLHGLRSRHKESHCQHTGGKRNETVKSDYGCQRESGPSHVVWNQDDSFSPAVETAIIAEEDDKAVPERDPSFVTEFAEALLRPAKQRDRITSLLLVY